MCVCVACAHAHQVGAKYNFDPSRIKEMEAEVAAMRSEDADLSPKGLALLFIGVVVCFWWLGWMGVGF